MAKQQKKYLQNFKHEARSIHTLCKCLYGLGLKATHTGYCPSNKPNAAVIKNFQVSLVCEVL